MERVRNILHNFLKLREQLVRWRRALLPMVAVVVFAITYALILPAITLDDDTAHSTPGIGVAKSTADDVSSTGRIGCQQQCHEPVDIHYQQYLYPKWRDAEQRCAAERKIAVQCNPNRPEYL